MIAIIARMKFNGQIALKRVFMGAKSVTWQSNWLLIYLRDDEILCKDGHCEVQILVWLEVRSNQK